MKKISLSILLLFFMISANAQNCMFTYYFPSGTNNTVAFSPDSMFTSGAYHFSWTFGDGGTSTQAFPTHTYNSLPPYYVCYNVYDTTNTIVCSACDSSVNNITTTCAILGTPIMGTLGMVFQANVPAPNFIRWDFGDGSSSTTGNPVTHIYATSGTYTVCIVETDALGTTLCTNCSQVIINPLSSNCNFTTYSNPANNYSFSFSASVLQGSTVTWNFGDNSTGTGLQATHTYNAAGPYSVCINVTEPNGNNCQYCDSLVAGSSTGNCYFSFMPDSMNANMYYFFGSPAYPGSVLTWDFNDGSTGIGASVNHTFASAGLYNVCMTETDTNGIVVCTSCNSIAIGNSGGCNYFVTPDPANPLSINFNVNNSASGVSVSWDFGDSTFATGANVLHTYATPGTYLVCITETGFGAVICQSCSNIIVGNTTGNCSFFFNQNPASNSIDFTAFPSSANSVITWDFNDGSTPGTGINVTHTFFQPGVYYVCMTESDSLTGNIICNSCLSIAIQGPPVSCQASFIAASLGLTSYFIDQSILQSNSSIPTYSWNFGDGGTSSVRFPQHTYAIPGTYTACLTITSGNCTDTYCSQVIADSTMNPLLNCHAFYAIVQVAPYQVTIVNFSSGMNLSFLWNYGDGSTDTLAYPTHFYSTTGSYNLCLTVSDGNGCSDTYCDTLNVDSLGNIFRGIASGFTINVVSPAQVTGVNEISAQKSFSAYPNPVTSELHVALLPGFEKATGYRILSLQGSEILSGKLNGTEGRINTQSISSGTYILEVTLSNGSRSFQSIIKN